MFGSLVATSESWVQIQDAFQICYNLDSEGFTYLGLLLLYL